jgi:hypothetical protein
MARPPSTYDGRTTTGNPIAAAAARASWREVAVPLAGCVMFRLSSSAEKRFRSSARSIESGDVPRILTPASVEEGKRGDRAHWRATTIELRGVSRSLRRRI